jgi:uncharacterized protein YuzE
VWRETLRERLDWKYDSAADVLYVSVGKPRKAIDIDIGQGVVVRYDEAKGEVVGLNRCRVGCRLPLSRSLHHQPDDVAGPASHPGGMLGGARAAIDRVAALDVPTGEAEALVPGRPGPLGFRK